DPGRAIDGDRGRRRQYHPDPRGPGLARRRPRSVARDPVSVGRGLAGRGAGGYWCVIVTSSTPASTRLPPAASAVVIRMRIVWPAKYAMSADCRATARLTCAALPSCWNTVVVVVPTIWTRKKSSVLELLRCAKYAENASVIVPLAGSVIAGDWIEVVPPSTSLAPTLAPGAPPVTRAKLPLVVVPTWIVPPLVVASGFARSQAPVTA